MRQNPNVTLALAGTKDGEDMVILEGTWHSPSCSQAYLASEAAMSEITSGTTLSRILKTRGVAIEAKGASWHHTIKLLVSHVKEACVDDSTLLS